MKFKAKHIVKVILVAAISMSALSIVGAQESTSTTSTSSSEPTGSSAPDPCAPTFMACELPTPVATPAPVNYEINVSFNDSDLGVALFKSKDADGQEQMDLYNVQDGTTNGKYMFSITQQDIAPYMTQHPEKNTLLASGEGVSVYVLTTGEIQVNAGPDAEGKYHVKIFDGIPWTHVYGYTIDPVK